MSALDGLVLEGTDLTISNKMTKRQTVYIQLFKVLPRCIKVRVCSYML